MDNPFFVGTTKNESRVFLESPGLAHLLSGGGFKQQVVFTSVYEYMSCLDILESTEENLKCKLQASIITCGLEPRVIESAGDSPKRKASDLERRSTDLIVADKTGVMMLSVWNELADEICALRRGFFRCSEEQQTTCYSHRLGQIT